MSEKLMQALAAMAERRPLRALYNLCDSQKQVSTGKLREYLDHAGDTLAGYAATLRQEFDMLTAAAPAAPVAQAEQEPVAQKILDLILAECKYWHCRDEARRGGFAALYAKAKEVADAAPPAHPDAALVGVLEKIIKLEPETGDPESFEALAHIHAQKCLAEIKKIARAALAGKGATK